MKKVFLVLSLLVTIFYSCEKDEDEEIISNIQLSETSLTIELDQEHQLVVSYIPESLSTPKYTWESSNTAIVTISGEGLIKGIGVGNCDVTVSTLDGKLKSKISITVSPIEVSSINLNLSEVSLFVGETSKLSTIILPENATNKEVEWSTENSEIATIDNGLVTAISEGETNIIAKIKGTTKSVTCNVKIESYFKDLNKDYIARDGLTVTLTKLSIVKNDANVISYTINYTLKNETSDNIINEGTFKIYYKNKDGGEHQYGFFGKLYPGESISRSYTFKAVETDPFSVLEYDYDNFFNKTPIHESLKWDAELK